ncbi:uncharacterized protein LOC121427318 [Lytechinus variegatus]|uniref:uncharacterized protein LOC121427318 n=1 Tax=Lytechinus variegatus TaxID=7654 RepID=UPI001BB15C2A|nr:uncharacterized protein LOC121427318 [Lytechinus variegatus]
MATAREVEDSFDDSRCLRVNCQINLATYTTTETYNLQDVRDFIDRNHGNINIDQRNEEGQTALMRACLDRNKEVVEFLLEKGADPNLRCLREGNTALHFLSQSRPCCDTESETDLEDWEPLLDKVSEAESSCKDFLTRESQDDTYNRLIMKYCLDEKYCQCTVFKKQKRSARIIDTLILQYGALIQINNDGLTPADIAGLHRKLSTVLHYINQDYIPESEQRRALEIMGSSFMMKDEYEKAYHAFTMAMENREGSGTVSMTIQRSQFESCLGRTESRSFSDLRKINGDKYAMKIQGILVADRVLPDSLKSEYVYERLVDYGYSLLFHWDTLNDAFKVFTECLCLERKGLLPIGRVLLSLMYSISQATSSPGLHRCIPQYVTLLCQSLQVYVDVISEASVENLTSHIQDVLTNLSMTLYSFTNHLCRVKDVQCVVEPVTKMIKVIWRRIDKHSVSRDPYKHLTNSVCHKLLCDMITHFRYYHDFEENKYTCNCFKQVLARLVQVEGALDVDMRGDTLLHSLVGLVSFGEIQMIADIAALFLKYGCPHRVKNIQGKMPIDIVQEEATGLQNGFRQELTILYDALSPATLTLQELSIRTILRYDIRYWGNLPGKLCSLIDERFLEGYDPWEVT